MSETSPHSPYSQRLDAIGLYIERIGGADVLVQELERGYGLCFLVGDEQRAVVLDEADLVKLGADAARRTHTARNRPRSRLRAVGRYLDRRKAAALVLQERADGFAMEFTSYTDDEYEATSIERVEETLSYKEIAAIPIHDR